MNSLGSITSHGFRSERRTFPACRSVANSTSFMRAVRGNSSKRQTVTDQPGVGPTSHIGQRLPAPTLRHGRQRSKGVQRRWRQNRRSSPSITTSCSESGSARSGVPGLERSRRIVPSSSSALRSLTVGRAGAPQRMVAMERDGVNRRYRFALQPGVPVAPGDVPQRSARAVKQFGQGRATHARRMAHRPTWEGQNTVVLRFYLPVREVLCSV